MKNSCIICNLLAEVMSFASYEQSYLPFAFCASTKWKVGDDICIVAFM